MGLMFAPGAVLHRLMAPLSLQSPGTKNSTTPGAPPSRAEQNSLPASCILNHRLSSQRHRLSLSDVQHTETSWHPCGCFIIYFILQDSNLDLVHRSLMWSNGLRAQCQEFKCTKQCTWHPVKFSAPLIVHFLKEVSGADESSLWTWSLIYEFKFLTKSVIMLSTWTVQSIERLRLDFANKD